LGPVMAYEALRHYSAATLTLRFVSNVDGTDLIEATRDLEPEETLFIVCSKSFATLETLTNAQAARAWSLRKLKDEIRLLGTLLPFRQTPRQSPTCFRCGSGSVAATRWIP
jgi:glucose-6-phosphate isomerase